MGKKGGGKQKGGKGKGKATNADASSESKGKGGSQASHVKCRHILCEKLSKMDLVMKRLKGYTNENGDRVAPEQFDKVAREMSEDKARRGGDLGWFARGAMAGPFEQVAFNLRKGEMSAPFKTKHGYHVVLCEGRK